MTRRTRISKIGSGFRIPGRGGVAGGGVHVLLFVRLFSIFGVYRNVDCLTTNIFDGPSNIFFYHLSNDMVIIFLNQFLDIKNYIS